MIVSAIKVLLSAFVIALVTAVAQKYPNIGGWIAALPLVSVLSAIWLVVGHQPKPEVIGFLTGVVKGLVPTAVLLLAIIICMRKGVPFIGSLSTAVLVWGGSSFLLGKLGWL